MATSGLREIFEHQPVLIGMIHLPALPGSPQYAGDMNRVLAAALHDAETLQQAGYSGVLIENLGDFPYYPDCVPAETVAAMAVIASRVRSRVTLPVGINVLRNDARSALAIASAAHAQFIRVNVLAGASLTDQGIIEGKAHLILRDRQRLQANEVRIFADIRVKHAAPLVERDLAQEVEEYFARAGGEALIVSGGGSGQPASPDFLRRVKAAAGDRPVLIGSGLTAENATQLLEIADGAIVGSSIKAGGEIHNRIDPERAAKLARVCRAIEDLQ